MIIIIWNIIKNIKIIKIARKIFSQTDQKKQPYLAVKACQLRDYKSVLCLESPYKIEFYLCFVVLTVCGVDPGVVEHLVKRDYYLLICYMHCLYLVHCLFSLFLFWFLFEFLMSHLRANLWADQCDQVFFFSIQLFLDLLVASPTCLVWILYVCFSGLKFGSNSFCTP